MASLILASGSPRRHELLSQLGYAFEVCVPNIDESVCLGEGAQDYVARLAYEKACAIVEQHPKKLVLAADTCLSIQSEIIGKPSSKQHAFEIWQKLSGQYHDVFTGICVVQQGRVYRTVVKTQVQFTVLTKQDMEQYWATGEPLGKAGAYAIQGIAAKYIPEIMGSYSNVVGLPLYETDQLLQQAIKALN
ncbi:Maf family nucleotide pyrophosphatase [Acinetobacter rathckeae]|uniref:Maf family nucleotide pyrophosphatase n=1 Tax=Acinetobacter rathckeae TaxID=2605272 RepID=UPI0018A2BFD3|nr:Maf family nucleotide pyrophosphatase [Acinetobacter rathckeae]MBF7688656.1 septum formation inhibitor Maf [Acinetobacter rathckeae]MBF7695902.1 septum formation inhibitor Maf [Acinetobacter rathckeae]